MDRLLSGAGGTISVTTYDANGDVGDVDGTNAPTPVVRDSAGVSAATPTGTRASAGLYSAPVPVTLVVLDTYTVTWTWPSGATRVTTFELVGSFLYSVAAFQAFDSALANETTYPPARIRDIRETVEERFERACGVSFTRRGRRELIDGNGSDTLWLSERLVTAITAAAVSGSTVTGLTAYPDGKVTTAGSFAAGSRNVSILYQHGYDPTPGPVIDAGLRYGRDLIVKGAFDDMSRLVGIQTEAGFQRYLQADKQHPTGIPDVDTVLADYNYRAPLVG